MAQNVFFERLQPLNGYATVAGGVSYEYRKDLSPYQSIDLSKSFFVINDTINLGTANKNITFANIGSGDGGFTAGNLFNNSEPRLVPPSRQIVANTDVGVVRAENHFFNQLSQFRVLINGVTVEENNQNLGVLDHIRKRQTYNEAYTISQELQNYNVDYWRRFLQKERTNIRDDRVDTMDTICFPDFSKVFTQDKELLGGCQFGVEFTWHPDYAVRATDVNYGTLPFRDVSGNVVGATYTSDATNYPGLNGTDYMTVPTKQELEALYSVKKVDLYVCVKNNMNVAPVSTVVSYPQTKYNIGRISLANTNSHDLQINVPRDITSFGFAFQHNNVGSQPVTPYQLGNFTGKAFENARVDTSNYGISQLQRERRGNQSIFLNNYRIEYGKSRYPYYDFNTNVDTTTNFEEVFARHLYENYANTGQLYSQAGGFSKVEDLYRRGPLFFVEFADSDVNDQDFLRLVLSWKNNTNNLQLVYFYSQNTSTDLVYDGSQNVTQVVTRHP